MKSLEITILLLLFSSFVHAQKHFAIDLGGGIGAGWWIHNYGSTSLDTANNRGWARSRLEVTQSVQGSILYRMGKWKMGASAGFHTMLDNYLDGNNHRYNLRDRIQIGENYVHFWNYALIGEYSLFQNERLELLTIHVQIGTFHSDTVHPDKERFGRQLWTVLGFKNTIRLKYFDIYINGRYRNASIIPNDDLYFNERHDIVTIGGDLGICIWLF